MKQFFRFAAVAAAAALSSSTALAGNWVVPAPTNGLALANLTTKDTVYVWNVGQKAWINRGESWGTQAVINASSGMSLKPVWKRMLTQLYSLTAVIISME